MSIHRSLGKFLGSPVSRCSSLFVALILLIVTPAILINISNGWCFKKIFILSLCRSAAYAYVLTLVSAIARRRWFGWVIYSITAVLVLAECLPVIFANKQFSPETLLLVIETDSREASSFLHQFMTIPKCSGIILSVLWIIGLPWLSARIINILHNSSSVRKHSIYLHIFIALTVIAGILNLIPLYKGFCVDDLQKFEEWYSRQSRIAPALGIYQEITFGDGITVVPFTIQGLKLNMSEMPGWENTQRRFLSGTTRRSSEADSVNVVVIIGESFIRHHSSLYGYPLATNPHLKAEADSGRLVAFTDYISPANLTSASLRNILNLNSAGDREKWFDSVYFPLVAAKEGWRVHLYDNQVTKPEHIADVQLSAIIRSDLLDINCYEWSNDSLNRYDGDFIERINREHPFDMTVGNLDLFHLYGQHFAAVDRYPAGKGYDRWSGDSIPYERPWLSPEKRSAVAQYDNATFYNDCVISEIIRRYAGSPTIFVYFSDHGEEMYDSSDCAVRNEPAAGDMEGWLKRQFSVPVFFFANKEYINLRPEVWTQIRNSAGKKGMLDNIGHTILYLAGTTTSVYRNDRNIISNGYTCPPRIIVNRFINYDSISTKEK